MGITVHRPISIMAEVFNSCRPNASDLYAKLRSQWRCNIQPRKWALVWLNVGKHTVHIHTQSNVWTKEQMSIVRSATRMGLSPFSISAARHKIREPYDDLTATEPWNYAWYLGVTIPKYGITIVYLDTMHECMYVYIIYAIVSCLLALK